MKSDEIRAWREHLLSHESPTGAIALVLTSSFFILCELTAQVAEFNERERERAATIAAALRGEEKV